MVKDGYCGICKGKVGHISRDCPHNQYNKKGKETALMTSWVEDGYQAFYGVNEHGTRVEGSHWILGSFFEGEGQPQLIQSLHDESLHYQAGVLDDGCTASVCGDEWLRKYEEKTERLERKETDVIFQFGRGEARGLFQVELPLRYSSFSYMMRVDVVPGTLPLLISRRDQIRLVSITDHRSGEFTVDVDGEKGGPVTLPMLESSSGHWLVPLAWK
jgi:hypothetical protein